MKKVISLVLVISMLFTCFTVSTSAAKLRNLDLAFVIDTTGSMGGDIDMVKKDMLLYLDRLDATGADYRIAIVDYRDFADRTGDYNDYPYMVQLDFTADKAAIKNAINNIDLGYGGDYEETVYSALIDGLNELTWRSAAGKAVILMGDAPALDPEPVTGYTINDVLSRLSTGMIPPQTHVVVDYEATYNRYEKDYFNKAGTALDGSNKTPNMCVPGLTAGEYMVPQGLAYFEPTNSILVSSYYKKEKSGDPVVPSVIYSLDYETGRLNGTYKLYNSDGKAMNGHVGGIATSDGNVYIADGKSIHYIPLSNFNKEAGTATVKYSYNLSSYLDEASCSYVTITDGILWTGNFYDDKDAKTKASEKANSVILGFELIGTGENEWNNFSKSEPDYTIYVDNKIENIQCATVKDNTLYLSKSYGRTYDSELLIADIALNKEVTVKKSAFTSVKALPMMECFFIKDGSIFAVFESGSNYYMNGADGGKKAKNPTDVIWKIDYAPLGVATLSEMVTEDFAPVVTGEEATKIESIGDVVVFAINTSGEYDTEESFKAITEATGGKYYDSSEEESVSEIIEEVIVEIPDIVVDEEPEEPEEPAENTIFTIIYRILEFLLKLHEIGVELVK